MIDKIFSVRVEIETKTGFEIRRKLFTSDRFVMGRSSKEDEGFSEKLELPQSILGSVENSRLGQLLKRLPTQSSIRRNRNMENRCDAL